MTRDEIIQAVRAVGILNGPHGSFNADIYSLQRFAELVSAAEREACAQLCDEVYRAGRAHGAQDCATAIRARVA